METENNNIPRYLKIQNFILDKIASGEYNPGDRIPSEQELVEMFGVSRITANSAIKQLATIGIIDRIRGKGSYVSQTAQLSAQSGVFQSNIKLDTMNISSKKHITVSITLSEPAKEIADVLMLEKGDKVFAIVRKIMQQNKVLFLDYTFIPKKFVYDDVINEDSLSSHYIHDFLKLHGSIPPKNLKLFIDTPCYKFMNIGMLGIEKPEDAFVWQTNVYAQNKSILATTYTVSKRNIYDKVPFMTFAL